MRSGARDGFHYRVKVRIEPDLQRLQTEVWIQNPPSNRFYLNKGFAVDRLTADGEPVPYHVDSAEDRSIFAMLGAALVVESESPRLLYVKYAGDIPETVFDCNMITPKLVELAFYTAWCPLFDGFKHYTFDVAVDMPAGFVTTTNGKPKALREEGDRSLSTWASYGPGVDIVLLASPNLRMLEAELDGTRAEIYFQDLPEELMKSGLDRLLEAKRTIADLYGPPGIDGALRLVYSPREGQGYLRIPFIVVSEERAKRAFAEEYGEADDFSQNCHEVAHFWWWLLAAPFTSEDWINEGLAEYTSFRICRQEFGEGYASKCTDDYRRKIAECKTDCSIAETPFFSPDREANFYAKTTLMYIEAERRFGRGPLDRLFKALHERFAATSEATTAAFLEEVGKQMGEEAEAFFREELYRKNEIAPPTE